MIRREIQSLDGTPAWLLISQVQHARLSGELARAWSEEFSEQVIAGITHHDDGWLAWEAAPQFNSHGRPLSFMELEISEALAIWKRSIAAARSFGPLAGAMVAGHFVGLASGSEQGDTPHAASWIRETKSQRTQWLGEWQNESPANTMAVAERAQQMLTAADLMSLWLCCDGPLSRQSESSRVNTEMNDRTATVLGKYRFVTLDESASRGEIAWQGSLDPWPLARDELQLGTPGLAARPAKYSSWTELSEVSWPVQLVWRLRKTLLPTAKC
jgi:hypothetical protein